MAWQASRLSADKEIAELKEKLEAALKALEYYGRRSTWRQKPHEEDDWIGRDMIMIPWEDVDHDKGRHGGKRAREAYRKIMGIKK